jgi:hypothetical protein
VRRFWRIRCNDGLGGTARRQQDLREPRHDSARIVLVLNRELADAFIRQIQKDFTLAVGDK